MRSQRRGDVAVYRRFVPLLKRSWIPLVAALVASACTPLLFAARIWLLKILIDTVVRGHRPDLLGTVAGGFVVVAVVRSVFSYVEDKFSGAAGTWVVRDLRVAVFTHLQAMSLRYFHTQRLGDLLTRLSGDISAIEDLLVTGMTTIVRHLVTIVLFTSLLIVLDPRLVVVAAGVLPVLAITTIIDARLGRRAQRDIRERTSELTSTAEESLSAIALVKSFARSPRESARFAAAAQHSATARLRAVAIRSVFTSLTEFVGATGTAIVVYLGARQVMAGTLSLGSLVVFISYLASLFTPIQGLSRLAGTLQRALVGAERVVEILDAPQALQERVGYPPLPPVRGLVALDHVTFGYHPDQPVLIDVSFTVSPGEVVAVVGASGAGKTSIVSLLLSYYDPQSGAVRLDGYRLHQFDPDSSRRRVAAVLQEPMLFDASVEENIRYGRLGASHADLSAAARVAQADDFIQALPHGYDTSVGPRGSRLSGGQRQRIAIARAVVKAAPVLVLDEATSALDPVTEARLIPALRVACKNTAVLLVAHRAATIEQADRVIVLENGRIAEIGTPTELRARRGPYWTFMNYRPADTALTSLVHGRSEKSAHSDKAGAADSTEIIAQDARTGRTGPTGSAAR